MIRTFKRKFRDKVLPTIVRTNILKVFENPLIRSGNVLNIYFHGVTADKATPRHMPFDVFAELIKYLALNYNIIPLSHCDKETFGKVITISFDDGHENLIRHAVPVLLKYDVPATFFVCLRVFDFYFSFDDRNNPDYRLMNIKHIKYLSEIGFDIGSHTINHPHLLTISKRKVDYEVMKSKCVIESVIGKEVNMFCFPYAEYDEGLVKMVREAGYSMLFGSKQNDLHVYPRFCLSATTTIDVLKAHISKAFMNYSM